MDNAAIADQFSLLSRLLDIHGENSFKSKTYSIAAFYIEKIPAPLAVTDRSQFAGMKGIGDSVARKIIELLDTGRLQVLDELIAATPAGVIELMQIKGLGPKKIHTIWKEMGIQSIGELQYACNENRLTLYKGFGAKTQANVLAAIDFYLASQGHFLYAQLDEIYPQVKGYLENLFGATNVRPTGAYRRQSLTIEELEFVVDETNENVKPKFETAYPPELLEDNPGSLLYLLRNGLRLRLYTGKGDLVRRQFMTTGAPAFTEQFLIDYPSLSFNYADPAATDESVFAEAGIPTIPACLREAPYIIARAQQDNLPVLIQPSDIKGIIHNHSNWSDGTDTIEDMAKDLIRRGMEYLVISDHSRSAAYANGLTEERIREQHRYIDQLNEQLAPFRIFKSIECDILNDGSLDYSDEVLNTFDLVIASVHSNLQMSQEKAMSRLLKAISHPATTILGHMTGRLLLSRNGYPLDHRAIIDACAEHKVVIELNAHPRRLDIDWQWIPYAIEKGVLLSINPDAHFIKGFDDIRYGVLAAQKGGLTAANNLSSFTRKELEEYLANLKI